MQADTFFEGASKGRARHATSAGPCELPILYEDASLLGLVYRVDPAKARALVPASVTPWVMFGKAVAVMCFFEYRKTSIGPYGEIGLGILSHRTGTRPSLFTAARDLSREPNAALHVVNLPVTSEAARAAGVEIWGYPKYVSTIDTSFTADGTKAALGNELTLTVGKRGGIRAPAPALVTYSVRGGRLIRTAVRGDMPSRWGGGGSARLSVTGDGPTSSTVRALGLDAMRPMLTYRCDAMRSILGAGEDVGSASA